MNTHFPVAAFDGIFVINMEYSAKKKLAFTTFFLGL